METLIAFHGDSAVKEKYLARVRAHRLADELIHGIGWDGTRGCAVGCTLDHYDHARYPVELGIPAWLARLEDLIFERLPAAEALEWPEKFLAAIPVGATDWENVHHGICVRRMKRLIAAGIRDGARSVWSAGRPRVPPKSAAASAESAWNATFSAEVADLVEVLRGMK